MRSSKRRTLWFAGLVAGALLVGAATWWLSAATRSTHERSQELQHSLSDIYQLSALEWEAIGSDDPRGDLWENAQSVGLLLRSRIQALVSQGSIDAQVLQHINTLLEVLDAEFALISGGSFAAARELDELEVDPTFDAVIDELASAAQRSEESASRTGLVLGILTLLVTCISVIGGGFAIRKIEVGIQASQRLADQDRFITMVSHELRTPLTAVLGLADLLVTGEQAVDSAEYRELLGVIREQSQTMASIIDDLLVEARSDGGTLAIRPERVNLASLVRRTVAGLGPPQGKSVEVAADETLDVLSDPGRAAQILRNLLSNAFRYGGDRILIRAHGDRDRACLDVSDNGAGISAAFAPSLFAPFTQGPGCKVGESLGIGLHISRCLAELMGGHLTYHDTCHDDSPLTTFRLDLPIPEAEPAAAEPAANSPRDLSAPVGAFV